MDPIETELLLRLAGKYLWWKSSLDAMKFPRRIAAAVMNIGDYGDVQLLATALGEDSLRKVLLHAEAGEFNERSWTYWHYRLGLARLDDVPPMPSRKVA